MGQYLIEFVPAYMCCLVSHATCSRRLYKQVPHQLLPDVLTPNTASMLVVPAPSYA